MTSKLVGMCPTCRGTGNLYTPPAEWWDCPACAGSGVRVQFGPAMLTRPRRSAALEGAGR